MLELSFLFVCIIALLVLIHMWKRDPSSEPFSDYYLRSCPSGYNTFYHSDGSMQCCNGEVIANRCIGDLQCTLGKGTSDMPNCVEAILQEYKIKGKEFCPTSMPSYFEDRSVGKKGCINGRWNQTLSGPATNTQAQCILYNTPPENQNNVNSCFNQKHLEEYKCFGDNCTKSFIQFDADKPPLLSITFTDTVGMPHTAYSRDSVIRFLDARDPEWRNRGFNVSKHIVIAEVAKAFYIDKTMSQSDVQL